MKILIIVMAIRRAESSLERWSHLTISASTHLFCHLLTFFFSKSSFSNTFRVSNSLDPDQARRIVGPDLGPNCLQRLSHHLIINT